MAHVVYQASAGFLWVDGMEVPFANVVMEITKNHLGTDLITIRSAGDSRLWMARVPVADIEDNLGAGYVSTAAWVAYWNGLAKAPSDTTTGGVAESGDALTQVVDSSGNPLYVSTPIMECTASLTRPADTENYTANDHISAAVANVKQKETVTLTGTNGTVNITGTGGLTKLVTFNSPVAQIDTITLTGTSGTANVAAAGGLTRLATFGDSLNATASAFVTSWAADYDAQGITITPDNGKIVFTAKVAGTAFTHPTITNETPDLAGTVANTRANREATLTNTAADFVTSWADDYLSQGIVVTSSSEDIIFEANVAGVPFTAPTGGSGTDDLAITVDHTTANVTLVPVSLDDMAADLGEGGIIMDVEVNTTITQLAGQTLRIWLFNATPSGIVGDNVAFTTLVANASKMVGSAYIDVPLNALLTGSDCIVGMVSPAVSFRCASGDTSLYLLIQTLGAATAPTSAGVINIKFTVMQITK